MNSNIRVAVRDDTNVDGLMDKQMDKRIENQIPILRHAKSRYDKNQYGFYLGKIYMSSYLLSYDQDYH